MARGVPKHVIDMLAAVPLFSGCSDKELRVIAGLGTGISFNQGATLTEEGKPGREFHLVVSGKATCTIHGEVVARFGPGDFFGEMSLLDGGPRTATVTADTALETLVLDRREFGALLDTTPAIGRKMLMAMAARLREADRSAFQ